MKKTALLLFTLCVMVSCYDQKHPDYFKNSDLTEVYKTESHNSSFILVSYWDLRDSTIKRAIIPIEYEASFTEDFLYDKKTREVEDLIEDMDRKIEELMEM